MFFFSEELPRRFLRVSLSCRVGGGARADKARAGGKRKLEISNNDEDRCVGGCERAGITAFESCVARCHRASPCN